MKRILFITVLLSLSWWVVQANEANNRKFPDVKVVSVKSGWKKTEIQLKDGKTGSSWVKGNIQCADYNGDGVIDYLRLQDPPNSFMHYIWVDNDHDGFFDINDGMSTNRTENNISVPKIIEE